jgi:hypothetical protein
LRYAIFCACGGSSKNGNAAEARNNIACDSNRGNGSGSKSAGVAAPERNNILRAADDADDGRIRRILRKTTAKLTKRTRQTACFYFSFFASFCFGKIREYLK